MFNLTDHQRLAIICGCAGLLGIVAFLTACLVCPSCWLHKKLSRRERLLGENKQYYVRNSFELSFMDRDGPPPPYESTRRTSLTDLKSSAEYNRRLVSINSVSSAHSDTDSVTGIPLPILSETEVPKLENTDLTSNTGCVAITLQFKKIIGDNDLVFPQLRIDLKEANDLPMRLYGGRPNPYFIMGIYETKAFMKTKRGKTNVLPLYEFHSMVVRKCPNPVYNESFFFPLENRSLKKCVLKIEAWDQDKLANDTSLGNAHYYLKDVAPVLMEEPSKELDITLKLEDAKFNYGQLLLGLCYLPTSERMTVAILKANNLMRLKENDVGVGFYVQAMSVYSGKISEKRKTSCQPAGQLPVFNEMLMFDVPRSKLEQVILILAVYTTVENTTCGEGGHSRPKIKDTCIGKVVIGASGKKSSMGHWNAVRNSPRRQVIQWHELR